MTLLPPLMLPLILIACGQLLTTTNCQPTRHVDDVFRIDDAIAAASKTADVTSLDCPATEAAKTRFFRLDPIDANATVMLSMSNYLLEMDLAKEIKTVRGLRTGPQYNYTDCEHSSTCTSVDPSLYTNNCNLDNKQCVEDNSNVMSTSHSLNLFVSCGNVRNCIFRKLSDITQPYEANHTAEYACQNSELLTEKKQQADGGRKYEYIQEMYNRNGNHYLMIAIDGRGVRTYRVPSSKNSEYEPVDDTNIYAPLNAMTYLKIFSHGGFVYTVLNDQANSTKIFRICMNSFDDYVKYSRSKDGSELDRLKSGAGSFNSVTIQCSLDGNLLNKALNVEFLDGNLILYYELTSATHEVAVCKKSIADINSAIRKARQDCSEENLTNIDLMNNNGESRCIKSLSSEWVTCGPQNTTQFAYFAFKAGFPFGNVNALSAELQSKIRMPNIGEKAVSFQTFIFDSMLYTFVGTTSGNAYKFVIKDATARLAEKVIVSKLPILQIRSGLSNSQGEAQKIVALTEKELSTFKAESCESLYDDCHACLASQDPFCGWCIYQARCTTVGNCEESTSPKRWIPTSQTSTYCPTFAVNPQYVVANSDKDVNAVFTGVELTLNGSFTMTAKLSNFSKEFGIAVVRQNEITFQIPQISSDLLQSGTDHATASLILKLNGRPISKSSFTLFDCTRIRQTYKTKACHSCLNQTWSCYWCSSENSCLNQKCSGEDFSINQCSKTTDVVSSTSILSGESETFQISATNLDIDQSYSCEIDSCTGKTYKTKGEVITTTSGNVIVTCNATAEQLACKARESTVKISVLMGDKIVDQQQDLTVTVYNCAIDSPLCGQCISLHHEFDACIWCNSTSSCSSRTLCPRIPVDGMGGCELPRITSVSPTSAPTDGGTTITIEGTNIGSAFNDINLIMVNNSKCIKVGGTYTIAKSIQCILEKSDWDVTSQVNLWTTYNVTAKSIETFSFKAVTIETFPSTTEVINDSVIKVVGTNLDTGNSLKLILEANDGKKTNTLCDDRSSEGFNCTLPNMPNGVYIAKVKLDGWMADLNNFTYEDKPEASPVNDKIVAFESGGGKGRFKVNATTALLKWMTIELQVEGEAKLKGCSPTPTGKSREAIIECEIPPNPNRKKQADRSMKNETLPSRRKRSTDTSPKAYLIYNRDVSDPKYVGTVQYESDPTFAIKDELRCANTENGTLYIPATKFGGTGLVATDYVVYLIPSLEGSKKVLCTVNFINDEILACKPTDMSSLQNTKIKITAQTKDLIIETPSEVTYCPGPNLTWMYAVIPVLLIMICCIIWVLYKLRLKIKKQRKERKMLMSKLDDLENATRETARNEYFQLQTGYMEDFTQNISHKINYRSPTKYFAQTFFNKTENIPVLSNDKIGDDELKQIESFENLLKNEEFLLFFITTLEEQKNFNVLQKGELASLLAVSFYEDLPYFTKVMLKLLADLIKAQASKNPKLLLRRSASVVEKMVSHWMSITMYDEYIYEQSGTPLFLLTKAIHYLVNLAPWDVTADKAMNSLNEMTLLGNKASYNTIDINASVQGSETGETTVKPKLIKVLDLDTITQAKEKIIEGLFSDQPYSEQPKPKDLELVLFRPDSEPKVLNDIDTTSESNGIYVKINTLEHFKVMNNDTVLLRPCAINTEQNPDVGGYEEFIIREKSFIHSMEALRNILNEENEPLMGRKKKLYHLISPKELAPEEVAEGRKHAEMIQKLIKTPLQEMFLTRMVKAKSTVQVYVNNVMKSILKPEKIPKAVCYFFGFLDGEASKNKVTDPEILHIWKTNSLLLRYWVNILKNPEFVFDIQKTTIVDSCLNVITQAFMDGCTVTNVKLSKDAPSNKLLYAKDVMEYKIWVKEFYSNVYCQDSVNKEEMDNFLLGLSKKFKVEFNRTAALQQMLGLLKKYSKEILAIMRVNESIYIRNEAYCNVENILKLGNGEVSFPSPQEISV